MSNHVKLMILCNNEIAIPAMQQMYQFGILKSIVVPEENKNLFNLFNEMLSSTDIQLIKVNKENLSSKLSVHISENNINHAWMMTFAYILPKDLINLIPNGFINFHYGVLPEFRGPNPILSHMLSGTAESGVTVHYVDSGIDTGPIIFTQKILIEEQDTFGLQLNKLGNLGANMAVQLLSLISHNQPLPRFKQDKSKANYYKNPLANDLMIKWNIMTRDQIIRLINACNPWNKGAGTFIGDKGFRFLDADQFDCNPTKNELPGTILHLDDINGLVINCKENKAIKINIICNDEGFFAGNKLQLFGIKSGQRFIN